MSCRNHCCCCEPQHQPGKFLSAGWCEVSPPPAIKCLVDSSTCRCGSPAKCCLPPPRSLPLLPPVRDRPHGTHHDLALTMGTPKTPTCASDPLLAAFPQTGSRSCPSACPPTRRSLLASRGRLAACHCAEAAWTPDASAKTPLLLLHRCLLLDLLPGRAALLIWRGCCFCEGWQRGAGGWRLGGCGWRGIWYLSCWLCSDTLRAVLKGASCAHANARARSHFVYKRGEGAAAITHARSRGGRPQSQDTRDHGCWT